MAYVVDISKDATKTTNMKISKLQRSEIIMLEVRIRVNIETSGTSRHFQDTTRRSSEVLNSYENAATFFHNGNDDMSTSSRCARDLEKYRNALKQRPVPDWAAQLYDASGKVPPGVLEGNLNWMGNYEQCMSINMKITTDTARNTDDVTMKNKENQSSAILNGKYCTLTFAPANLTVVVGRYINLGLCIPGTCQEKEIKDIINRGRFFTLLQESFNLTVISSYCGSQKSLAKDGSAIAAIVITSFFGLLVLVATGFDIINVQRNRRKHGIVFWKADMRPHRETMADLKHRVSSTVARRPSLAGIRRQLSHVSIRSNAKTTNPTMPQKPLTTTDTVSYKTNYLEEGSGVNNPAFEGEGFKSIWQNDSEYSKSDVVCRQGHNGLGNDYTTGEPRTSRVKLDIHLGGNDHVTSQQKNSSLPSPDLHSSGDDRQNTFIQIDTSLPTQGILEDMKTASSQESTDLGVALRLLLAFSLYRNVTKILYTTLAPGGVHVVNPIRFLSFSWIFLANSFNVGIIKVEPLLLTTSNALWKTKQVMQTFTFQPLANVAFAVDSFFVVGGFLVTYNFMKRMRREKNHISASMLLFFYFNRFWRLTPLYMMVLMLYTCIGRYLGDGPLWPEYIGDAHNCRKNWWTNLLYINNIVRDREPCMFHSWYLSTDMQFYLVTSVVLILLVKKKVLGWLLLVALYITHVVILAIECYNVPPENGTEYWYRVLIKPWCRYGAYLVGVLVGYVLAKYEKKIRFKQWLVGLCWILCVGCIVTLTYVTYTKNRAGGKPWSRAGNTVYGTLCRTLFPAAVAWILFACIVGYGGIVNSILAWTGWLPFSKLTYGAYLVHPFILYRYAYSQMAPLYGSQLNMAYVFPSHAAFAYALSFLLVLLFEVPMRGLEKAAKNALFHLHLPRHAHKASQAVQTDGQSVVEIATQTHDGPEGGAKGGASASGEWMIDSSVQTLLDEEVQDKDDIGDTHM